MNTVLISDVQASEDSRQVTGAIPQNVPHVAAGPTARAAPWLYIRKTP